VHQVRINATLPQFLSQLISVTLQINATPTNLWLHDNITQQGGKRFNLTVTYNATSILGGKYLTNSSMRCILNSDELIRVNNSAQLGNGCFYLFDLNNGTYKLGFLIDIGTNRTQTEGDPFTFLIIASQPGFIDGTVNGLINIWVWNTSVVFTHWDSSVNYRDNVTINLTVPFPVTFQGIQSLETRKGIIPSHLIPLGRKLEFGWS
jgi:hypothetical protein